MADPDEITRLNAALEGRYRIVRELGEGGMATVHLADDLRHGRKVALKVLKPELAAVVGAERFLAEIRTTANLQHPNVLPLYDSGEADGLLFYVMAYVEGETLRDRLAREHQLPIDDAVRIAANLAEVLDYAHRRGVIHRDIKPANVLLQDGKPVISDFGIALAVGSASGRRLTETGLSLGTPQYMSPEQATGDQHLGPTADVYALGCVLYEMLVGEPPFTGSTPQAVLGKIITGDAPSAASERRSVPAHVDAAIARSLEKVPADRFGSAGDLAAALADPTFRHGSWSGRAGRREGSWKWIAMWTGGFAAVFVGAFVLALLRPWAPPPPVEHFGLAIEPEARAVSVLPDGSGAIFARDGQLVVRRWESPEPTAILVETERVEDLTASVSPAGDAVAFISDRGLLVAPLTGGTARRIVDDAYCCPYWAGDGFIYFSIGFRSIWRVPAGGGSPEEIVARESFDGAPLTHPALSAEGDILFYTALLDGEFGVWATRLSTGERRMVVAGIRPRLAPTGHLLFASPGGELLAARFDSDSLGLRGAARPVLDDLYVANHVAAYDISRSGDLVYRAGTSRQGTHELVWVTREGEVTPVDAGESFSPTAAGGGNFGWALSPDGRRVAFQRHVDGNSDIWVKDLPDGPVSRLTYHPSADLVPSWTPDGTAVTWVSRREDEHLSLWSKRPETQGDPERVVDGVLVGGIGVVEHAWSPHGDWVVMRRGGLQGSGGPEDAGAARDLFAVQPRESSPTLLTLVASPFHESGPAVSPDGRWLAYSSDETGIPEVYVRPFPGFSERRWQISTGGGYSPRWGPGGRELYFIDEVARALNSAAFTVIGDEFARGSLEALFSIPAEIPITDIGQAYDVAPDGRFLMARQYEGLGEGTSIKLVRNFQELLRMLEDR